MLGNLMKFVTLSFFVIDLQGKVDVEKRKMHLDRQTRKLKKKSSRSDELTKLET